MTLHRAEDVLLERFERARREPPLMMLYPPVSTGRPYEGTPGARTLWSASAPAGTLYVHVPFCRTRCIFCPFYAVIGKPGDFEIAYTFGVRPLQQYLVPFPGGRLQTLGIAWDSRPKRCSGKR